MILGLDYGSKTVGVAIADPTLRVATAKEIIRRERETKLRSTYRRLLELIEEYNVSEIVVGLPMMLSGDEGERVLKTREFAGELEKRSGCVIHYHDERLTTVEAIGIMDECGISKDERYKYVDMIAAQIILQSFLDSKG